MPIGKKLSLDSKRQALQAMIDHDGSVKKAAQSLGFSPQTLSSRLTRCQYAGDNSPKALRQLLAAIDHEASSQTEPIPTSGTGNFPIDAQQTIADLKAQLAVVTAIKRYRPPAGRAPSKHRLGAKHMLIPDCQVKADVPLNHLEAAGNYAAEKRPDKIIFIGDFADMPSLSSYDRGKLAFEGRRYRIDVEVTKHAMAEFLRPIRKEKNYNPEIHITLGNHEDGRIIRAVEEDSRLEGLISINDLGYSAQGLIEHPFLKVVTLDGIAYSHFFPRSAAGAVTQSRNGAPNAKAQLVREGRSASSGHLQGLDMHCQPLGGKLQWGVIAGSFYQHDETYLTPQGNAHWRGLIMKHEVQDGYYNPMVVSLEYLLDKYG